MELHGLIHSRITKTNNNAEAFNNRLRKTVNLFNPAFFVLLQKIRYMYLSNVFHLFPFILNLYHYSLYRLEQQRTQRELLRCKTGVARVRQSRKTRTRLSSLLAIEAQRVTLTPLEYLERVATHFAFDLNDFLKIIILLRLHILQCI